MIIIKWIDFSSIVKDLIYNSIFKKIADDLYLFFRKKIKAITITTELNDAIRKNRINDFIIKYNVPEEKATQIRLVTRLRQKIRIIERIIEKKFYDEKSVDIISKLINELQELEPLTNLVDSGIKFKIRDLETKQLIITDNENYIFALLKRFIATIYTHICWKGLAEKGILLNFDYDIIPLFSRYRSENISILTLEKALDNMFKIFNEWEQISNIYQKAIQNLLDSRDFVLKLPENYKINNKMSQQHLFGLVKGLEAEKQYWFYNISDKITLLIDFIHSETKSNIEIISEILDKITQDEDKKNEFMKYWDFYSRVEEGMSGIRNLLEDSLSKLNPGKEKEQFCKRLEEIPLTKTTPLIFVQSS